MVHRLIPFLGQNIDPVYFIGKYYVLHITGPRKWECEQLKRCWDKHIPIVIAWISQATSYNTTGYAVLWSHI